MFSFFKKKPTVTNPKVAALLDQYKSANDSDLTELLERDFKFIPEMMARDKLGSFDDRSAFLPAVCDFFGMPSGPKFHATDTALDYVAKMLILKMCSLYPDGIPTSSKPLEIGSDMWNAIQKGEKLPGSDLGEFSDDALDAFFEEQMRVNLSVAAKIPSGLVRYEATVSIKDANEGNKYAKAQMEVHRSIRVSNHQAFFDFIDHTLAW